MAEAQLIRTVARQYGVFTRRQALDAGMSEATICRRVAAGRWLRRYAGVYADPVVARSLDQDTLAACLACADSLASHRSAALLYGLELGAPACPEVTVVRSGGPRPSGVKVYRSRTLTRGERAVARRIPTTAPARTILDLAGVLDEGALETALDSMFLRKLVTPERLLGYLASRSSSARRGSGVLRRMVAERVGSPVGESELEALYLRVLRPYGVPLPQAQHRIQTRRGRKRIDFAYPPFKVAIELDSFEWHEATRERMDRDRARQNEVEALGWTLRRFTKTHCIDDPIWVATTTAEAIGLAPVRWASGSLRGRIRPGRPA